MKVVVNGAPRLVEEAVTVAGVVELLGAPERGTAVAVNGNVVPRREWTRRTLEDGDRVEVLTAVQGG